MRPAIGALIVLASCTLSGTPKAKRPPAPQAPPIELLFHTDVEFAPHERKLLAQAADDIADQTGHHVLVRFVYDLDYHNQENLPPLDQWYLTRLDSMTVVNYTHSDSLFLGLTIPRLKQTILVFDRLGSAVQFRHTAMHEFLHALGVPHLPCTDEDNLELAPKWCQVWQEGKIMVGASDWANPDDAPLCMNAADADAVARVTHQPRGDFKTCL